jgi:hypothetical protein
MIQAKVIADSINEYGDRLTTLEIRFHRYILAEVNTHRKLSRNSASTRAIPLKKQLLNMLNNPCMPIHWGKNKPGMSASEELTGWRRSVCQSLWAAHRYYSAGTMWLMEKIGLHKQVAGRLGEAHYWHTAIVSSTEWGNFFKQRRSPLAQPEIRALADCMYEAIEGSTPKKLKRGEWHLPYIGEDEVFGSLWEKIMVSVARCARVSYLQHDGIRSIIKDINMFKNTLFSNGHWSPMEHVAQSALDGSGNFDGFTQLRLYAEERILTSRTIEGYEE